MANSISKIYIEGRTYDINATINDDDYKIVIFKDKNTFIQKLTDLAPGNFCFVVEKGELLLCEIITFETAPAKDGATEGNYTYYKKEDLKKAWREFQITNLINSKLNSITKLLGNIQTAAQAFKNSLEDLAAGTVKLYPTLESFLNAHTITKDDVSKISAAGVFVITLGRYNINDGGGATYYITDDATAFKNVDGSFIYGLEEGRSLVFLHDEYIHFAQIGGKANDPDAASSNTDVLQRFCAENQQRAGSLTLKFGSKTYYFNQTVLNGDNFSIEGTSTSTDLELGDLDGEGTIIAFIQNGDNSTSNFLWSLGGRSESDSYYSNITLKNLTFTGAKRAAETGKISFKAGTYLLPSLVKIGRVQKGYFENLTFNGFQGCGLTLQSVYASSFENLKFWHGFCLNNRGNSDDANLRYAAMTFGAELAQETSDLHFGNIMFKQIAGSHMLFEKGCKVNMVHFDSVFFNAGMAANNEYGDTIWSNVKYNPMKNDNTGSYTTIGAIHVASGSSTKNVVFRTVSGDHFGNYIIEVSGGNGGQYLMKTLVYFEVPGESYGPSAFGMHFEHVICLNTLDEAFIAVYTGNDRQTPVKDFMFEVNNLTTDMDGPMYFKTTGVPRVKLCHLGPNCLKNLKSTYENFIEYFKDNLPTKSEGGIGNVVPALVAYDEKSLAKNHLVGRLINNSFRPGTQNTSFDPYKYVCFIPIAGDTLRLRYKARSEINYAFLNLDNIKAKPKTNEGWKLPANANWTWTNINIPDEQKNGAWVITFSSDADNTANDFLDVFYFK